MGEKLTYEELEAQNEELNKELKKTKALIRDKENKMGEMELSSIFFYELLGISDLNYIGSIMKLDMENWEARYVTVDNGHLVEKELWEEWDKYYTFAVAAMDPYYGDKYKDTLKSENLDKLDIGDTIVLDYKTTYDFAKRQIRGDYLHYITRVHVVQYKSRKIAFMTTVDQTGDWRRNNIHNLMLYTAAADVYEFLNKVEIDTGKTYWLRLRGGNVYDEEDNYEWDERYNEILSKMEKRDRERLKGVATLDKLKQMMVGDKMVVQYRIQKDTEDGYKFYTTIIRILEENGKKIATVFSKDDTYTKEMGRVLSRYKNEDFE